MAVNYSVFSFAKKDYVISTSSNRVILPFLPARDAKIIGTRVRKLFADNKNGEIQCRIPDRNEQEKHDNLRSLASEGFIDLPKKFQGDIPCGPFVAKKLRLAEEPLANEALSSFIQTSIMMTINLKEHIIVTKFPKNMKELLAFHGFDKQPKPASDDICRN